VRGVHLAGARHVGTEPHGALMDALVSALITIRRRREGHTDSATAGSSSERNHSATHETPGFGASPSSCPSGSPRRPTGDGTDSGVNHAVSGDVATKAPEGRALTANASAARRVPIAFRIKSGKATPVSTWLAYLANSAIESQL
jgi:hypothetical protein